MEEDKGEEARTPKKRREREREQQKKKESREDIQTASSKENTPLHIANLPLCNATCNMQLSECTPVQRLQSGMITQT